MNPKSSQTLISAAVIGIVFGLVITSAAGGLFFFGLAVLSAAVVTAFGQKKARIIGAVALAAALGLLVTTYPKYQAEMARYMERAKERSVESPPATPTQKPESKK